MENKINTIVSKQFQNLIETGPQFDDSRSPPVSDTSMKSVVGHLLLWDQAFILIEMIICIVGLRQVGNFYKEYRCYAIYLE